MRVVFTLGTDLMTPSGRRGLTSCSQKTDFHTIPLFNAMDPQPPSVPSLVQFTQKINFLSVAWVRKSHLA